MCRARYICNAILASKRERESLAIALSNGAVTRNANAMSMLLIIAARTTPRIGIAQKVSRWEDSYSQRVRLRRSSAVSGEVPARSLQNCTSRCLPKSKRSSEGQLSQ